MAHSDAVSTEPEDRPARVEDPGGRADGTQGGAADERARPRIPAWVELPLLVVVAVAVALLIRATVLTTFYIPSGSMEDTLQVGDRVLVNTAVHRFRDVRRGEVVVFTGPASWPSQPGLADAGPQGDGVVPGVQRGVRRLLGLDGEGDDFIKRVIGVGGDTVSCCVDGRVVVQPEGGEAVALDEDAYVLGPTDPFGPVAVPEGFLFMMGDNRTRSSDSRRNGVVGVDEVVGRAFVVVWPPGEVGLLGVPDVLDGPVVEGPSDAEAVAAAGRGAPATTSGPRRR